MLAPDSNILKFESIPSHILASMHGPVTGAAQAQIVARGGLSPGSRRRVREYIDANLEESISIERLATLVGLSRCHFARAFKQSEGVTPHHFLFVCRVRRAQELLVKTDWPLSQIAIASGFSDQSHCSRRFRELVGLTPKKYRWLMR
jgi:transcriptional regulator GlxA family with amidase domain